MLFKYRMLHFFSFINVPPPQILHRGMQKKVKGDTFVLSLKCHSPVPLAPVLVFDAFFLNFYKDLALSLYKIYAIYHIYSKLMANVTSTNPLLYPY